MTDWGGLSTKEVSADLKGGIIDTSALRVAPATPANPLATFADVLAAIGGVPIFTKKATLTKADGSFTLGDTAGAYVDFPGVKDLALTVTVPGADALVLISGNGGHATSNPAAMGVSVAHQIGAGAFVDVITGTEGDGLGAFGLALSGLAMQFHQGGGINAGGGTLTAMVVIPALVVGSHTFRLRASVDDGGFPVGQVGRFYASVPNPFRMIVLHK